MHIAPLFLRAVGFRIKLLPVDRTSDLSIVRPGIPSAPRPSARALPQERRMRLLGDLGEDLGVLEEVVLLFVG